MALIVTLVLGLFLLFGMFIIKIFPNKELIEHLSVALAFGAMVALAAFDLIPEILEEYEVKMLWLPLIFVVIGVLLLKAFDRFIPDHHDDDDDEETEENLIHIGMISAVAIILHNVVEGMTVYNLASQSAQMGFTLAIGIGLHNIPMGMLIYAGIEKVRKWKRHTMIVVSVLSTFIGGLLMMFISGLLTETVISLLICIALGMVIYIIIFELRPSILHMHSMTIRIAGPLIGFVLVLISTLFE